MHDGLAIAVTPWLEAGRAEAAALAEQGELAEALGFHSFWLPENHFSGPGSIPQPLLLLAAVAARTQRLRLGTTSYLLPVRNPIHAAAEVAVLDRLSGGRVILGVGRGFQPALFAAFDIPASEKRARFEAILAAMQRAWRGEPVLDVGEGDPITLAPLPVQRPHPPIWVAALGPRAVAQAGRLGLPYLASPMESRRALAENCARHGEAAAEAGHPPPQSVPVMRTVFVSKNAALVTRVEARLEAQAAAMTRAAPKSLRRLAGGAVEDWALVGEPAAVADGIARYREEVGMTHLIVRAPMPAATPEEVVASLEGLAAL